ncbi:CBS domain-containing protein [Microtetraspora sp. AC03309]|uniref:CBS domain-containing protein n=1 Tax=Microtetraspora sp. AC03309 TaxID=2779376 RepID=UPI001E2B3601|nr:CBS domain-containing protein [Microtetraspora sp. AC03309]MCC5579147.1 CBS domain-containing protein [Microtetraspora sp. AC03309]
MTTARNVMHFGVQCIGENENLLTAARMMRDLSVGSLPVCGNDDRLKGIITDRDIVIKCVAAGKDCSEVTAKDLAQGTLVWIDAEADLEEALHTMEEHQIRRLPVLENHRLVGVITEADLAAHLPEDKLAEAVSRIYAESTPRV